jgi:hypothetical protein
MQQQSETSRWSRPDWLFVAGAVFLALVARLVPGPRTIDDAYITFRYARNLAKGLGFVYNPGQAVLGTTTPLYTWLMSLAWLSGLHDLPTVAPVVNALADAGTAGLLYWLGLRLGRSRIVAVGVALLWAVSPVSVTFAIGGMETSVVVFLLTASFSAYSVGRSRLSAALIALAVLTRPDALIAAGLLFADMALRALLKRDGGTVTDRMRRLPWTEVAIFFVLLLPWLVFSTAYFDSPIPQSVRAKVRAYSLDELSALVSFLHRLSTPFLEQDSLGRFWPAVGFPLYLFLFLVGGLRSIRRAGRALPLILYPIVYVATFSIANAPIFRWYEVPPLPAYFLCILVGLETILRALARRLGRERVGAWVAATVIALLLAVSLAGYTLHPDHGSNRPAPKMAWLRLELFYRQVADLLNQNLRPGDVVAVGDIGAFGWYTDAPILDTVGLVSPEAVSYYPLDPSQRVIIYAISPDLIRDFQPEYLVTLEVYVRKSLLPEPWFQEVYTLVDTLNTEVLDTGGIESGGMLVFERQN